MHNELSRWMVYFNDGICREYEATTLYALTNYFLYTPRLEYSYDDILDIELVTA